jgi:hypothetical protein
MAKVIVTHDAVHPRQPDGGRGGEADVGFHHLRPLGNGVPLPLR